MVDFCHHRGRREEKENKRAIVIEGVGESLLEKKKP